jgi:hypothetical protein
MMHPTISEALAKSRQQQKHVLDKLGADYRTEAVTRGRQLGLIRLRGASCRPRRHFRLPIRRHFGARAGRERVHPTSTFG